MSAMSDGSSEDEYVQSESEDESESASDSEARSTSRSASRIVDDHLRHGHDVPNTKTTDGKLGLAERAKPDHYMKAEDGIARLKRKGKKVILQRSVNAGYHELLNSAIEEVRNQSTSEYGTEWSSQIGASFWSAEEKEAFFQAVASKGVGNLAAISESIRSKGEAEVQAYISFLQDGLNAARLHSSAKSSITYADIDAACEVSENCELVLNAAADDLARAVDRRDVLVEQRISGDDWLIDNDAADQIEMQYEQDQRHPDDDPGLTSQPDIFTSATTKPPAEATSAGPAPPTETVPSVMGRPLSPSETLLRPATFLALSRNLFMNSQSDAEQNWQRMQPISSSSSSDATDNAPALFRSAFDDLYTLAVSLTRRLVQAAIIQATSRLRAEDTLRTTFAPAPLVREVDVRTAVDVLGLRTDWQKFWASAPRRCGVGVFSREARYDDGRPGSKVGFPLDYDEVEAALGLGKGAAAGHVPAETTDADEIHDVDVWEAVNDETLDLLTEEEHSDEDVNSITGEKAGGDGVEMVDTPAPEDSPVRPTRKRKFDAEHEMRIENRRLEYLDRNASLSEERKLWEAMRMIPPEHLQVPQHPASDAQLPPISSESAVRTWRARTDYQAAWEQPQSSVHLESFEEMEARGLIARRRRIKLYDRIRERLQVQGTSDDDGEESPEHPAMASAVSDDAESSGESGGSSEID